MPLEPATHTAYNGTETDLRRTIGSGFYFAKNRVYAIETYSDEMRKIQGRQEFSSTLAAVSVIAAGFTGFFAIVWIPLLWRAKEIRNRLLFRTFGLFATFATVYAFSYLAYIQESEEFNRRVFGYHDSMLRVTRIGTPPSSP